MYMYIVHAFRTRVKTVQQLTTPTQYRPSLTTVRPLLTPPTKPVSPPKTISRKVPRKISQGQPNLTPALHWSRNPDLPCWSRHSRLECLLESLLESQTVLARRHLVTHVKRKAMTSSVMETTPTLCLERRIPH